MRTGCDRPVVLIVHARGVWSGVPRLPKVVRGSGARVVIFAPVGSDLWRARYVDERVCAPAGEGAFAGALRAHLEAVGGRYAWVLIADENAFVELATQPETGWLRGWFPVAAEGESLERMVSKAAFAAGAAASGIAMPESHVCWTAGEAEAAGAAMGYPVMVKAAQGFGGNGVRRAGSAGELVREFRAMEERLPLVVQRFEVGRVGSTQVLFDQGKPTCWASSYKLAVFPEPFGPSSARELMVHPEMEGVLEAVGRMTGFHGLAGIDWLHREADGKLLVIEFNPRPAPVVHLGHVSGVDFSGAIGDMLAGRSVVRRPVDVGPRKVFLFPQYAIRCIEYRRWRDMLEWLPGGSYKDIPWDQPGLLAAQVGRLCGRLWRAAREKVRKALWRVGEGRAGEIGGGGVLAKGGSLNRR